MKILCVASALDVQLNYGCTPAWWQFLKGLHELGHDVVAVPYAGGAFATPWWRCYANPCQAEGSAFGALKKLIGGGAAKVGGTSTSDGAGGAINRKLIESWVRPRWEAHLAKVLETERDVDAVIVFSVPLNHFTGLPSRLRAKYG